jgi:hypothetical protein
MVNVIGHLPERKRALFKFKLFRYSYTYDYLKFQDNNELTSLSIGLFDDLKSLELLSMSNLHFADSFLIKSNDLIAFY